MITEHNFECSINAGLADIDSCEYRAKKKNATNDARCYFFISGIRERGVRSGLKTTRS